MAGGHAMYLHCPYMVCQGSECKERAGGLQRSPVLLENRTSVPFWFAEVVERERSCRSEFVFSCEIVRFWGGFGWYGEAPPGLYQNVPLENRTIVPFWFAEVAECEGSVESEFVFSCEIVPF
jgi:hypothetical protein